MTDTLEIVDLENLIRDEPDCVSQHKHTKCSVHVTYFMKGCNDRGTVCASHVEDPNNGLIANALR